MIRKSNLRGDRSRQPFHGAVVVAWQDHGQSRSVRANGLNVSDCGLQVVCTDPIEVRTIVHLKSQQHEPLGDASVRFCRRSGLKYQIGLEFNTAPQLAMERRKRLFYRELPA